MERPRPPAHLTRQEFEKWQRKQRERLKWVRLLQAHESRIEHDGEWGFYYVPRDRTQPKINLRGITRLMGTILFDTEKIRPPRPPRPSVRPLLPPDSPLSRKSGRVLGTLVHKQLADKITLDDDNCRRLHPNEHPWVDSIKGAMELGAGLTPFCPEFRVESLERHVATAVDTLAYDSHGRIWVIEVKTGSRDGLFDMVDGDGWIVDFLRPLLPFTPFGRSAVQLMITAELLRLQFGIPLRKMRLAIFRVDDAAVELSEIDPRVFQDYGPALLDAIAPLR